MGGFSFTLNGFFLIFYIFYIMLVIESEAGVGGRGWAMRGFKDENVEEFVKRAAAGVLKDKSWLVLFFKRGQLQSTLNVP